MTPMSQLSRSIQRALRSRAVVAASLAIGAGALGFACGSTAKAPKKPQSTLPRAGSPKDDGTGLLARLSVASPESAADLKLGTGAPNLGYGGSSYGGASYGMYGGDLYGGSTGGARYGGSIYANYRFNVDYAATAYVSQPAAFEDYVVDTTITRTGTIEGKVTWPRAPKAVESLPVAHRGERCGETIDNETLVLDDHDGVAHAVVYLEDIKRGRGQVQYGYGGVLERIGCRFSPHMQVAGPIGVSLRVTDSDGIKHTLRATQQGKLSMGTADLTFELGRRGSTERHGVNASGFYRIDTESDADFATAWVVVPKHPYYVVTEADGSFRLDGVPPGTYTLVAWHEPVTRRVDGGEAVTGKVVVTKKKVKVTARKTTTVVAKLPAGR